MHQEFHQFDSPSKGLFIQIIFFIVLITTVIGITIATLVVSQDTKRQVQAFTAAQKISTAPPATTPSQNTQSSCSVTSFTVARAATPAALDNNSFSDANTAAHFVPGEVKFFNPLTTPFSCVDARDDGYILGAPGGDFSEFLAALTVYFRHTRQTATNALVAQWLSSFLDSVITPSRPFYFHSDTSKMGMLLANMSARAGVRITIFPTTVPTILTPQDWLDTFSLPEFQGCGHVRLTLANPVLYGLADYEQLPKMLLQELMEWYWLGDDYRKRKFDVRLMSGSLDGKSVVIFNGNCSDEAVSYHPTFHGSSVFLYSGNALAEFREKVVTKFFATKDTSIDAKKFYDDFKALADLQLGKTLELLSPANKIPLVSVTAQVVKV